MCGRFCIAASPGELKDEYGIEVPSGYQPCYNISPGQQVLIITGISRNLQAVIAQWGFHAGLSHRIINARMESVQEKPFFRDLFTECRCLIPASGYYEWKQHSSRKVPFYFSPPTGSLLSFAGIFRPIDTGMEFAILTSDAVHPYSDIHSRMPVIIHQHDIERFLFNGEIIFSQEELLMHEVSPRVNRPGEDGGELIQQVKKGPVQKPLFDD